MVIVLISARYKNILEMLNQHQDNYSIDIIKQIGGKVFLYVDTDLSQEKIIRTFHKIIQTNCYGALVYEFYGIYNGKIDFHAYLSSESKDQMKYYQTTIKDIKEQDIEQYLKNKL